MTSARRTEAAERDFANIGYQIAVEDGRPELARHVLQRIAGQCDRLAQLAASAILGTPAPEIGTEVRLFPCMRWVLLFRYDEQGVVILRIADGNQDYLSWKI